ncbi:MAG: T9SS type A sorting domain-containing protein [Saprospiraceae bacterium]|nr:T9SS type A sorting domain-containing protein [Saprospiraceae bacterium]
MKTPFLILLVLIRIHLLFSQPCSQPNLTLQSQADLQAFVSNSGGCTEITGDLFITGNIQNVNGLEVIEKIYGNLTISNTSLLENIGGLAGLNEVGGYIRIQNNEILKSLNGLNNLRKVKGDFFYISNNQHFKNLGPLSKLDSINGIFQIYNLDSLETLQGLQNLKFIGGDFSVFKNKMLKSLSGLSELHIIAQTMRIYENPELISVYDLPESLQIGNQLVIYDNPKLNICNAPAICRLIQTKPDNCFVNNNADGCNNTNQISQKCISNTNESGQGIISVFPNPAGDYVWIEGLTKEIKIEIFNVSGIPVSTIYSEGIVNIFDLPQGTYIIRIKNEFFRIVKG